MPGALGQLHALVNRGVSRNAIEIKQLKHTETQRDENLGIEPGVGVLEQGAKQTVQLNLPAQHSENQRGGEMAIGSR